MTELDDQAQTRLALAALVVAVAQTLGARDESFPSRLDANLERVYRVLEDYPGDQLKAMETVRWAHELVKDLQA